MLTMIRIRSNFKKRLKQKFIVFILLLSTFFVSYFLIKNTQNISNEIKVKEINIGADNEK